MCRFVRACLIAVLLAAVLAPAPANAAPREKLWADGVYMTARLNGDDNAMQRLVYDNYGDVVAQYYDFDCGGNTIAPHEASNLTLCYDYWGPYNIFSYEKLGYVVDNVKPRMPGEQPKREWNYEMTGNKLKFTENGKKHTYTLPIGKGTHYVQDINGALALIDQRLFAYKTGKEVASRESAGGSESWRAYLNVGYAIIADCGQEVNKYTVIDDDGNVLWQGEGAEYSYPVLWTDRQHEIQTNVKGGVMTVDNHGAKYEVKADENEVVWGINDHVVYTACSYDADGKSVPWDAFDARVKSVDRLVRYETGQVALVMDDRGYSNSIEVYEDYVAIVRLNDTGSGYAILDAEGNLLSHGPGRIEYLGHGLFSMVRGSYFGVVSAKGEWLLRLVTGGDD